MPLQAPSRIQYRAHIARSQTTHAADERSDRPRSSINPEIDEAALDEHERLNRMMSDVQLRAKFAMQRAQICTLESYRACARVGESLSEGLNEVVTHFAFEFDFLVELETGPGADPAEIRVAGLVQPQIIREYADLHVLLILSLRQRHYTPRQQK